MKTKKIWLSLFLLLLGSMAMQAQSTKADRLKYIRQAYAEAKQKVADNGKDGNPRLDMTIYVKEAPDVSENALIVKETKSTYYYEKVRRMGSEGFFEESNGCYFFTRTWKDPDGSSYRELLFDPQDGSLLFSYTHTELYSMVTDLRYYYDEQGNVIERSYKIDNKDAIKEPKEMKYDEGNTQRAQLQLDIFNGILNPEPQGQDTSLETVMTKEKRLQFIRNTYAKAKQKVERDNGDDTSGIITITVHDQEDGDSPAETTEIKFYKELIMQHGTYSTYCYFITANSRSESANSYHEYLFAPESHDLIFSFDQYNVEGRKNEVRIYYDETGESWEMKVSDPEDHDDHVTIDTQKALQYIKVFNNMID